MVSESTRMASAAQARLRIDTPNFRPRVIKIIALDQPSERVVLELARGEWNRAAFLSRRDLTAARLADDLEGADLVVMVATAGEDAADAALIGDACSVRRVPTTGLILGGADSSDQALAKTLAQLRPWMLMLVIASSTEYIEDMLRALRA